MTQQDDLQIIGRNAAVDFVGHADSVPAKVDTGADSSSVWASHIKVDRNGVLSFQLFDVDSPHYTGKVIETSAYKVAVVRSATGHEQIRYRVEFSFRVDGKRVRATLNLSDRSRNKFPVLIGRRTLSGKFMVDVSKAHYKDVTKIFTIENGILNKELQENPYNFYKKYYGKDIN